MTLNDLKVDAAPAPAPLGAAQLFRRHASFVASFLMRLGVNRQDVDDLVQEVFLTAHRRGGFAPGAARPTTWLSEIALRVASTARRTRRRRPVESNDAAINAVVERGTPFDAVANQQALERVQQALDTIELDRRAVFILFEIEGESCDSIAAGLGIPIGTVYSRLHTARGEFQKAYRRQAGVKRGGET